MTKIELVKGTAFELDPSKHYLLVFDRDMLSPVDLHKLILRLGKDGFTSLGVMIDGDPKSIKVIEQEKQ